MTPASSSFRRLSPLLALAALVALSVFFVGNGAPPAQAQSQAVTLVSNIGQASGINSSTAPGVQYAQGFTTGSNAAGYSLTSIEFKFVGTESAPARFRAELWSATTAGLPDAKLKDLTLPSSYTAGNRAATAPASTTLNPNTKYFAVIYGAQGTEPTHSDSKLALVESGTAPTRISAEWNLDDRYHAGFDNADWAEHTLSSPYALMIRVKGAQLILKPGVPPNLTVTPGDASLGVSFDAASDLEANYRYYVRWRVKDTDAVTAGDQSGDWEPNATGIFLDAAGTGRSGTVPPPDAVCQAQLTSHCNPLTNDTVYEVQVRARNFNSNASQSRESDWSASVEGTPKAKTWTFQPNSYTVDSPDETPTLTIELSLPAPTGGLTFALAGVFDSANLPTGMCSGETLATSADVSSSAPTSAKVAEGETSVAFRYPFTFNLDDRIGGATECFGVQASTTATEWTLKTGGAAVAQVLNENDAGRIAFGTTWPQFDVTTISNHTAAVDEDAGTVNVPVSVNVLPETSTTFDIEVVASGTTATEYVDSTNPGDFRIGTKSVTFTSSDASTTQNLVVIINDDTQGESAETIELRLAATGSGDHHSKYTRLDPGRLATLTIQDDDDNTVPGNLTATAGDGSVTAGWTAPPGITVARYEAQVKLKSAGSWPATDTDVAAGTTSHTFTGLTAGAPYQVRVRTVPVGASAGMWTLAEATPYATLTLSASPNPVDEGGETVVTVTLSAATAVSATIPLTLTAGTAEAVDYDWKLGSGPVHLTAGATSGSSVIVTAQDAGEDDETLTAALGATLPAHLRAGSPSSVEITIRDDEGTPMVRLAVSGCGDAAECSVREGEGVGLLAVLSKPHRESLIIPVLIKWGREYKNGSVVDYGDADADDLYRYVTPTETTHPSTGETYRLYTWGWESIGISTPYIDGIKNMQTNRDADAEDDSFTVELDTGASDWPELAVAGSPSSLKVIMRDADRVDVPPGKPPYVRSTPGDGRLDVSWLPPSPSAKGAVKDYDVHYTTVSVGSDNDPAGSDPASGWVAVERGGFHSGAKASQAITGLENGVYHRVRVRAVNPAGSSAWAFGWGMPQGDPNGPSTEPAPALLEYILVHYDGDPPVDDFYHADAAALASYGYRARVPDSFVSMDPDRGEVLTTHVKLKIHPSNAGTTLRAGKVTWDANGNRNPTTLTAVSAGLLSHAILLNAHSPLTIVDIEATHDGVTRTYMLAIDPPPRTYSLSPSARVVEGREAALTLSLSRPAPEGGVEFTVSAGYGSAGSGDVGEVASPVTVPGGQSALQILAPTVDDGLAEQEESFRVTVAPVRAGWAVDPVGTDTATVTIEDNDGAGQPGGGTVVSPLPDVALEGGGWRQIDLSGVFRDPEGGDLTYSVASSNYGVASGWVNGATLWLVATGTGTATMTVTAEYPDGNTVSDAFQVTVAVPEQPGEDPQPNRAPTVSSAIADTTIASESGTRQVSLGGVFSDADGDALTITAASSNEAVATVSVSAGYSSLTVTAKSSGTATITVTANDGNGGTVDDTFTVTVKAAPVAASALSDVSGLEAGSSQEVSLAGVFSDADGDSLTVTADSSNNAIATVSVAADRSRLTLTGVAQGEAAITVTAEDVDGNRASGGFRVTVAAAQPQEQQPPQEPDPQEQGQNRAPTVSSAIADATIVNQSGTRQVSLSGVFSDADNDALTITAVSSNQAVATVSVSADYASLTVTARSRGTATITVTANDGNGGTVSDEFTVRVKAGPTVASAIADATIVSESGSKEVSLSGVFSDADGDQLTITAGSSNDAVATVSVAADYSRLTVTARSRGTATVTATAQDADGNRVSDTFDVAVKAAPVVASAIGDVSGLTAGDTHEVSLAGVFSDADGDQLTITAGSSNIAIATVSVAADQSRLTLAGVAQGTATITVTAEDSDGNRVSDAFAVSVVPAPEPEQPNRAPTVASAIGDATIVNESGTHQVSLSGVFADADSDSLTITAGSSDPFRATVSVAADYSSLTVNAQSRGVATITVTAKDGNGGTVDDSFTVTVKAAPVVAQPLADVSGLAAGSSQEVSLSGVFSDADGDSLTITASSSDDAIATVTVASGGAALTVTGMAEGAATITVTARDSDGNTVSDDFNVSVEPEPEQDPPPDEEQPTGSPTVVSPLPDISLEGAEHREFDLSAVFHDPDGDELTFSAKSSNYGVATTLHVSGTTLTVVATGNGTATITVTAEDPDGNEVSDEFQVTVTPAS